MSPLDPFGTTPKHLSYHARAVSPESVALHLTAGAGQVHPVTLQDLRDLVRKTDGWPGGLYMEVTTTGGRLAALRVQNMPPAPDTEKRVGTVREIRWLPSGTLLEYAPPAAQQAQLFVTKAGTADKAISLRDTAGNPVARGPVEVRRLLDLCAPDGMRVVWEPSAQEAAE